MQIAGIVFFIAGVISAIYGNNLNNDMDARLRSLFEAGKRNPGNMWIYIGIAIAIVGLVMFLTGNKRSKSE